MIKREEKVSKFINILSHYNNDTLLDKSGKLIKIIKLSGIDYATQDGQSLLSAKNTRNNLLKSFSSEFAFYFWEIRKKTNDFPSGVFENEFANEVNKKYLEKIQQSKMFHKELYLGVVTKHSEGVINKGFGLLKQLSYTLDKNAREEYLKERHKDLNEVTRKVLSALAGYNPIVLSCYLKKNVKFSECLEFISELINFERNSIPLKISDASTVLAHKRFFFNSRAGVLEARSADNTKKFAAMLSIKGYQPVTYPGMLDELNKLKIEYVLTQSFRFFDRQVAKTKLRDQQKEMLQSKEESITQTEQIDEAFDDAASGEVGYGLHHFTLACYADSQEELNKHVAMITACFSNLDIVCVREDTACECAFWAQLPGNFTYILRAASISTKNMASFASLHNYPIGKIDGNHWGDAVTVFETLDGTPYYFNFHYKDVGNFLIFGSMGSGKTVLVGFLILQSMKFGGKRVIFDKDRGLEILVRAMGGVYETIKPGISTGFNPCQLEDTLQNRKFLSMLFKKILTIPGEHLSESDISVIENAIDGLYRLHKNDRQFCHLSSFFGAKKKDSLRNRFDQWHSDGAHAWAFDNATDLLNLNPDVIGFDLTHILNDPDCKTPVLMYLTYQVEKAIEGHRGMLFVDEGWLSLNDEYFKALMNDWSRTPRKKNNIFGLATQVANDTVNGEISKSINECSFCKIFYPNSSADRNVYVNAFGLTEYEYHLIKTLPDDQYYFLLNWGRSVNKESVVLRVNLREHKELLAVISARESTLLLLDKIRTEVGDDPKAWLPFFYARLKQES